jgi:ATP-dependent Lhr-like helicase
MVRTVIVDELHALADNKRGAHLALSLERLEGLLERPPVRVGISATQKPMSAMASFLLGRRDEPCEIIDTGYMRERDLALELTASPLQTIMSNEVWTEIYERIAELARNHRSTLMFVNTRRLAERAARHLAERLGDDVVTAHHGSLSREHRLDAERRLKNGELKVLVATASLELGIDIGDVDLTVQLGSPRAIATFLQRVGRSGHGVEALPKGRLFPLSRDELVECTALLDAVRRGELDAVRPQGAALDVLAQQIVAEVAAGECASDDLFARLTRAWPYRDVSRVVFDQLLGMLADGFTTRRGRHSVYLHLDAVNGRLRARRGARLTAITNGGAIPDQFDVDVVLLPEEFSVGSLNEDFAFESSPGDIFQLGNTSYRILRSEIGRLYVEDAQGAPPSIPFWFGEAPGRSDELSHSVSRLRETFSAKLAEGDQALNQWLVDELQLPAVARTQLRDYLAAAHHALGGLPTRRRLVIERFFDELGDTHVVLHSPYGSRINRAWGLALRKRFCRKFNFELQAAAMEDSIVLSLGPTHSFPLDEVAGYLKAASVRQVLTQALLTAPVFPNRWRWVASIALAVRRNRNGKRLPPQFQRSDAEDLLAVIFPDQLACAENLPGEREVPDHPLVQQAIDDCLNELMDIGGLEKLLAGLAEGDVVIEARDLTAPSPLAQEILNARPYAFLDDAPAEERRTQAIRSRHLMDPDEAARLAKPDPAAIDEICAEAWPLVRDADELHDALVLSGFLSASECRDPAWQPFFAELTAAHRATCLSGPAGGLWVSAERLGQLTRVLPEATLEPPIAAVGSVRTDATGDRDGALRELLRSRLETLGPVTAAQLAAPLAIPEEEVKSVLQILELEGFVMQGYFRGDSSGPLEWCERRLLARIHRRTLKGLRRQVEPVSPATLMRFLLRWQGLAGERAEGPPAVQQALQRLQGFVAPAVAWEKELLPARASAYLPSDLDQLLASGQFFWLRPATQHLSGQRPGPVRNTPISLVSRAGRATWLPVLSCAEPDDEPLPSAAARVEAALERGGAQFFADLVQVSGLLRTQVEEALAVLVARGRVSCDSFAGLRALITPASRRASYSRRRRRGAVSLDGAGRWSLVRPLLPVEADASGAETRDEDPLEAVAIALLDRYGVVFRSLLQREQKVLPPWRQLVRVLRRLEARGEVRGGRFVNGFGGEQFAWPEAVKALRQARNADTQLEVVVSAADPLNLAGIITPGERIPSTARNRLLYRGGVPVAVLAGGSFRWLVEADAAAEWSARSLLMRNDPRLMMSVGSA